MSEYQGVMSYFSHTHEDLGPLSTYSQFPVEIDGVKYPTAVHAIQVMRALLIGDLKLASKLYIKRTANECNRLGEAVYNKSFTDQQKLIWLEKRLDVICQVLRLRVEQNIEVRESLLKTKGMLLVAYVPGGNTYESDIYGIAHTILRDEIVCTKNDEEELKDQNKQ